jgi:CHRD domain
MKARHAILALITLAVMAAVPAAAADEPPARTFVAVLTAADEVPLCAPATNAARGIAIFHVRDAETGLVEWKIVANNLPGDIVAAHIHIAPTGTPGPVVQALPPTPGAENGVIATGTFTNAALVAAIQADPANYYVNVHTDVCPPGVIRGQLDRHGPLSS